jgi:hypothetical protein
MSSSERGVGALAADLNNGWLDEAGDGEDHASTIISQQPASQQEERRRN